MKVGEEKESKLESTKSIDESPSKALFIIRNSKKLSNLEMTRQHSNKKKSNHQGSTVAQPHSHGSTKKDQNLRVGEPAWSRNLRRTWLRRKQRKKEHPRHNKLRRFRLSSWSLPSEPPPTPDLARRDTTQRNTTDSVTPQHRPAGKVVDYVRLAIY